MAWHGVFSLCNLQPFQMDPYDVRRVYKQFHGDLVLRVDDDMVKFMATMAFEMIIFADDLVYHAPAKPGDPTSEFKKVSSVPQSRSKEQTNTH